MNGLRLIAGVSCALLLTACGTQPPRPASSEGGDGAQPGQPPETPPVAQKRGGYYLDDGPEESTPSGLDAIPDAVPRYEPLHKYANSPYSVFGKEYVPSIGLRPYKARGMASWYGKRFHGLRTSSGEVYDMYGMTGAHPTLPIPSYARVTNVASGKSVVVRINDRGPFHSNRLIDLSYTAARKLGYVNQGSAKVEVETIIPEDAKLSGASTPKRDTDKTLASAPPGATSGRPQSGGLEVSQVRQMANQSGYDPLAEFSQPRRGATTGPSGPLNAAAPSGIYLQLGAFNTNANAESLRMRVLRELAWLGEKLLVVVRDGKFRLHAGPYATAYEAGLIADRIREILDLKPMLIQQ
jgi:rare lipoprotein A